MLHELQDLKPSHGSSKWLAVLLSLYWPLRVSQASLHAWWNEGNHFALWLTMCKATVPNCFNFSMVIGTFTRLMVGLHIANSYHLLGDFLAARLCNTTPINCAWKELWVVLQHFHKLEMKWSFLHYKTFYGGGSKCGKREEMPLNFSKYVKHKHFHAMMAKWHFTHRQLI